MSTKFEMEEMTGKPSLIDDIQRAVKAVEEIMKDTSETSIKFEEDLLIIHRSLQEYLLLRSSFKKLSVVS